jgi:beta-glucosidase
MSTLKTPTDAPYRDASLDTETRVDDLLQRMSREEKIRQLGSAWVFSLLRDGDLDRDQAQDLLASGIGQVTRIAGATTMRPEAVARVANEIQRYLREETRLGIPAIVHEEVCSGLMARDATIFPQAIGVASTWEPAYNFRLADAIRARMRATGSHQGLSPVLDVVRDPRWGRTEETYGEDPHLVAQMGVAFVRGLQGETLRDGVVATAKHFVGYGASEGGMNWAPAHLPPRELREVYLHPFEAVVRDAGLASIMNGYHEIDGVPCGANPELLTDILRGEWGFTGTVVSDYFAVEQLASYHRLASDPSEAATMALEAGIDVELPATDGYGAPLAAAMDDGRISDDLLDTAVRRVLRQKFDLGLFESPYVDEAGTVVGSVDTGEADLALDIARRSIVLLANEASVLPLDPEAGGRVALIGPNADEARHLLGDYTFVAHIETLVDARKNGSLLGGMPEIPDDLVLDTDVGGIPTIRDELASRFGDRLVVARGCGVSDTSTDGFEEAVALAADADVAVLVLGDKAGLLPECTTGESRDRSSLELPGVQEQLVEAIAATGTPIVAVLVGGRPMGSAAMHARCAAVLMAWLPGQTGARAIAEILVGEVSPSGKLPISYPRSVGQIPIFYAHKLSGGRSHWHGDYVDSSASPLYPFGHGLSYSDVELRDPRLQAEAVPVGGSFEVVAEIANVGDRPVEEVVQVYIRDPEASVTRPVRELKSFARVALAAGAVRRVRFTLHTGQLGFYDRRMHYTVEPGTIEIHVGFASDRLVHVGGVAIQPGSDGSVDKVFSATIDTDEAGTS